MRSHRIVMFVILWRTGLRKVGRRDGRVRAYTLVGSRRWVSVAMLDAGTEQWVLFDAEFDEPPEGVKGWGQ